jgi:heat shock protein HtpX
MKTSTQRDPMSGAGLDVAGQADANRRRAALALAVLGVVAGAVVVVVLVALVAWPVAIGAGALAGLMAGSLAGARATPRAMRLAGGVPADGARHARLVNLVEGLSLSAGVPPPEVFVLSAAAPNALTLGRDARHARLIVTDGVLEHLSRIELEGVVAHELSHIRAGDIRTATLGAGLLAPLLFLGRPATGAMRWLVGSERETLADLRAVSLTRYPPGLAAALEAMAGARGELPAPPALDPLWTAGPERATGFGFQPPLAARIEALREL